MANIDITVQSFLKSGRRVVITIDESSTVAQLKTAISNEENVDTSIMDLYFGGTKLEDTDVLQNVNIGTGSYVNSSNNISGLSTKEAKQVAYLTLASAIRAFDGNPRSTYDLSLLPTKYVGNDVVDNPNVGGLVAGRPWTE